MIRSYTYQQRREVLELYLTHTVTQVSQITGLPDYTVRNIIFHSPSRKAAQKMIHWTEEDTQYLKDNYLYMSNTQLARNLNRTRQAICAKLLRLGLCKVGKGKRYTIEEAMKIYPYTPTEEICQRFGLSRRTILNAAYRRKIHKSPECPKKPETSRIHNLINGII